MKHVRSYLLAGGWLLVAAFPAGCSVRGAALNQLSDVLAEGGTVWAQDNDPTLIAEASPFSLKLIETVAAENPKHGPLLTAAARGFTQYGYAFVEMPADELEDRDLKTAQAERDRARKLYLRAQNYGLRALEAAHSGFTAEVQRNAAAAARAARREDVPALYWTAAAMGAGISLSKDDPGMVVQTPVMAALIDRALELDESWDAGAIHTFLISYEPARQGGRGDPLARATSHYERALQLSGGKRAAPHVAFAEAVCVARQDRKQFEAVLGKALAVDVDAEPSSRLSNLVMQRRARWLLSRTDHLFSE